MKIKKNDLVKIITGKDKGKQGKVIEALPKNKKVVIEEINLLIKHLKPKKAGEKGQKIQFPAPLDISNVMLICPKCGKATRVEYRKLKIKNEKLKIKEKKARICKKCKEVI